MRAAPDCPLSQLDEQGEMPAVMKAVAPLFEGAVN